MIPSRLHCAEVLVSRSLGSWLFSCLAFLLCSLSQNLELHGGQQGSLHLDCANQGSLHPKRWMSLAPPLSMTLTGLHPTVLVNVFSADWMIFWRLDPGVNGTIRVASGSLSLGSCLWDTSPRGAGGAGGAAGVGVGFEPGAGDCCCCCCCCCSTTVVVLV